MIAMKDLFNSGYYTQHDLRQVGFKAVGENVSIAKNCTIVGVENISLGNNVRIDGYSTITAVGEGWLNIGSYVHIGSHCVLLAGEGIDLDDFSGLSHGVKMYTSSEDYSGKSLTNPTVPECYTNRVQGAIKLGEHVIIGSSTVVLPKVSIGEGSAVGAQSLVNKSLPPWGVFFGSPAKRLRARSKKLLELEDELHRESELEASVC